MRKKIQNIRNNQQMVDINPTVSINTLNTNGLNIPVEDTDCQIG